jgi:8-oxo-dGTP pyrophosphatase MutT (NUDIX family)
MPGARLPIVRQVSAGGVVYRAGGDPLCVDVALVKVGPKGRWQLPKGIVDAGEQPEEAAIREVREEAGVDGQLLVPIDVIEYWYVGSERGGERVRFHKFVHFFLLEYTSGDVGNHDYEVEESRWVPLADAEEWLAFESERKAMRRAVGLINYRLAGRSTPPSR